MTMEGPLDIYLVLYGWKLYNVFWSIIIHTGIVFVPILWIVINTVLKAREQHDDGAEAAVASKQPLVINVAIAFAVMAFALAPFTTLETSALAYINPCIAEQQGGYRATGTTYDATFGDLSESVVGGSEGGAGAGTDPVGVPIWWRLVMATSYGLNRSAIAGLGCTEDLALVRQVIDESRIDDPLLANELYHFRDQCFTPVLPGRP